MRINKYLTVNPAKIKDEPCVAVTAIDGGNMLLDYTKDGDRIVSLALKPETAKKLAKELLRLAAKK